MEASALRIVITVVKYGGRVVAAVPALWEKATRATCPLFEAILILMGSVWIYSGDGGARCRGCGHTHIQPLTVTGLHVWQGASSSFSQGVCACEVVCVQHMEHTIDPWTLESVCVCVCVQ